MSLEHAWNSKVIGSKYKNPWNGDWVNEQNALIKESNTLQKIWDIISVKYLELLTIFFIQYIALYIMKDNKDLEFIFRKEWYIIIG